MYKESPFVLLFIVSLFSADRHPSDQTYGPTSVGVIIPLRIVSLHL